MSGIAQKLSQIQKSELENQLAKDMLVEKALFGNEANPIDIIKASEIISQYKLSVENNPKTRIDRKSIVYDPFVSNTGQGFFESQKAVNDNTLRRMSRSSTIVKSIITTRVDQISAFINPFPDKYSTGFVIRPKRKVGETIEQAQKRADKNVVSKLTDFITNCGSTNATWEDENFDSFTRKVIADSLTLDKMNYEIIRDRKGNISRICSTDAALTKIVNTKEIASTFGKAKMVNGFYPTLCQVLDGRIVADFYPWEMAFTVRNPTTDIHANGYGISELEDLIYTITSLLWTEEYNARFFKQGSMPRGILKVSNGVNQSKLNELRQEWMSLVAGVSNAHRMPILEADKFDWIDLHKSNLDMEFSEWQNYLIKLACAVYKIDPSEVGFPMASSGGGGSMFESNNAQKIEYSRDKGLKPLVSAYQFSLNKYVVSQYVEDYELVFVGIDSQTEQQEDERLTKAVSTYMTVNEVRATKDLKPLPNGDIILNPIYAQSVAMSQQQDNESNAKQNDVENPFAPSEAKEESEDVVKSVIEEIQAHIDSILN